MTKDEICVWAAGMFEGEGMVRITKPNQNGHSTLRCELTSTDQEIVDIFWRHWDGTIVPVQPGKPGNCRPQVRWVASGKNAYRFLQDILPYLQTARVQEKAKLGLEFQNIRLSKHIVPVLYEEMKKLNERGLNAPSNVRDEFMLGRKRMKLRDDWD